MPAVQLVCNRLFVLAPNTRLPIFNNYQRHSIVTKHLCWRGFQPDLPVYSGTHNYFYILFLCEFQTHHKYKRRNELRDYKRY